MRPLKLIITGFGTYCKRTEIDLEQLGSQGLYLITGDTGSGKTTIFDAITYALFGNVNGDNREVFMIRSTFADLDTPTQVELTFEYRSKIYNVKRNPEYERKSLRGDSVTKQLADAILTMPNGSVITQQKKVTDAIEDILGIDAQQFSQIVMIAQGDFQKLLMEGTETRQEIFRKIFKTDYYKELQIRLSTEERRLSNECEKITDELSIYMKEVSCNSTSTLNIDLEKAKENKLNMEEKSALIEKIIEEDSAQSKTLEKKISELEKQAGDIKIILSKEEDTKKLREAYKAKTGELERTRQIIETAKEELEEEKKKTPEREKKEAQLAVLNQELKQYDELSELLEQVEHLESDSDKKSKELEIAKDELDQKSKEKEKLSKELKKLADAPQKYFKISGEYKELEEEKNNYLMLEQSIKDCQNLLKDYENLKLDYTKTQKTYEDFDVLYKQLRKTYMDEQAGIIAQELKLGEPCPVCGSVEHPHPAGKSDKAPSKEEVDKAEKDSKKWEQNLSSVNAECVKAKADYENAHKHIVKEYEKLAKKSGQALEGPEELEEIKSKVQEGSAAILEKLESCRVQLQKENENVEQKNKIEEELPQLDSGIEELSAVNQSLTQEISGITARLEEKNKQAKALKEKLKYDNSQAAQAAVNELETQIQQMKEALENAQQKFEQAQNNFTGLEAEIKQISKQLEGAREINTEELEQQYSDLTGQKVELSEEKNHMDTRLKINKSSLENINKNSKKLSELEDQYKYVLSLSKTANGNLANGKERIKLETFIQMNYFDRIIAHANKRLLIMSDLQYELVRKKQADNLKSLTGLELDVIDHYNGGQRSVKTLSGGEAFQASLSLALGLSDEVRLSAGGIKIDTMFVDEGFGTLDSEALQKAFKALSGITEGNRLVGIISHVDLLKEKIDRQIIVKKERTGGSTVKVMV